ncbi:TrlF family AAA-like ATPase [Pectinatus frisingensis]|uniref:TrlF family AAA-like ATPase n=1 Tax=Pectinatus frisingensis TaxID=865 RepID=UPI0018C4EC1A|nr:AAA family ATPase [Pectinatus frisingensis]
MALAKWYKIDFHTHTPASNCFPDKNISADEWLGAAKASGMNAVVITDHNSVDFIRKIDCLKNEYENHDDVDPEKNFKVFYGIEVCVSAVFTHILIIFDDSLTITEIEDAVIRYLGIDRNSWGDTEKYISEEKLKYLCLELKDKVFVIPAHFASNKGLAKANLNTIKKYQEFVQFSAIEVRNEEDIREYENKLKSNAINEAVCISGSDNPSNRDATKHSVEGFGKMFTWIKLSALNFEGLRQVFIDFENRALSWLEIKKLGNKFNPNDINYNYIGGICLTNFSHLRDINLRFSPHLNCIIGSRGTGKSTLVNAINYGLDSTLDLNKCKVLKNTMKNEGRINIYFNFGKEDPYQITSRKEKDNLVYSYENNSGVLINPPEFKIDFYGQKEIFNLIEDENNINENIKSPLLQLIDDKISIKLYKINDNIEQLLTELLALAEEYKNNRNKIIKLPGIKAEISKVTSILKKYEESNIKDIRVKKDKIYNINKICGKEINEGESCLNNIADSLQIKIDELENKLVMDEDIDKLICDDAKNILSDVKKSYETVKKTINQEINEIEKIGLQLEKSNIVKEKEEIDVQYKLALEKVKNTGSEDIETLQDKILENKQQESNLLDIEKKQIIIEEKINSTISKYLTARLDLTKERANIIKSLDLDSIKIEITPICHKNRWKQNLQKELGKENVFDNEFEKLVEFILNDDAKFEHYKKFIFFLLTSKDGNISDFCQSISDPRFINIWITKHNNNTLNSIIKVIPEDMVTIKISDKTGDIDINEGSPGQKSAAILAFIMSSGENPLIIDQPEDDLDNSLIYNLIVKSIRKIKNKRQIIIVTHNPNIPVLGDAEGIIILERENTGKIYFKNQKKAGCLEEKNIRTGICEIMEGGESAFKKREEKYLYK